MARTIETTAAAPARKLDQLPRGDFAPWRRGAEGSPEQALHLRVVEDGSKPVIVAGDDAQRREELVRQAAHSMPSGTPIEQADATWQVLERAAGSGLVVVAGELDGTPAESVLHMLSSRHPQLPMLAV